MCWRVTCSISAARWRSALGRLVARSPALDGGRPPGSLGEGREVGGRDVGAEGSVWGGGAVGGGEQEWGGGRAGGGGVGGEAGAGCGAGVRCGARMKMRKFRISAGRGWRSDWFGGLGLSD